VFCDSNAPEGKIKTKVRRLYDISNVFLALGIITKSRGKGNKKPAYLWKGLQGYETVY